MSASAMHSTGTASVNQSVDSVATSSLQRSGLSLSIGDTKSIVLALQALQEKIRKLELDRNHHQEQYAKAQAAHEQYKMDMGRQIEQERAHHRQRERELQDLLARANDERARLQSTLEDSRLGLGNLRSELEAMQASERENAAERENKLKRELEEVRREVEEEKRRYEGLQESIQLVKQEKESLLRRNRQLEEVIHELTSHVSATAMAPQMEVEIGASARPQQRVPRSPSRNGPPLRAHSAQAGNGSAHRPQKGPSAGERSSRQASSVHHPPPQRLAGQAPARWGESGVRGGRRQFVSGTPQRVQSYQGPTYSSLLRDVRHDAGEAVARAERTDTSVSFGRIPSEGRLRDDLAGAWAGGAATRRATSTGRSNAPNAGRTFYRQSSLGAFVNPTKPNVAGEVRRQLKSDSPPEEAGYVSRLRSVHAQIQGELDELDAEYRELLDRAAREDLAPDVVAAKLTHLAHQMGTKREQARLVQAAQRELSTPRSAERREENWEGNLPARSPSRGEQVALAVPSDTMKGYDKATQRSLIVNELKALLSRVGSQ